MLPTIAVSLAFIAGAFAGKDKGYLSFPPSEYWDGIDGKWSSFFVGVGTPAQTLRLLPGTSASAGTSFWAVYEDGCTGSHADMKDCDENRGRLYNSNNSTTWSTKGLLNNGLYELLKSGYPEFQVGLTGHAFWGFDTVQLGLGGSGLPALNHSAIAKYVTDNYWIGTLGLSPMATNFTEFNDGVPSMLHTLKESGDISSTSWGYTAGAAYKVPPVYGSLTLGGQDLARYNSSKMLGAVPFGSDTTIDLLIGLQSITYDARGADPLLSEGVYAFIDSMVSQMFLPKEICDRFESAFNLTWDDNAELYLVTEEQHKNLVALDPTFTFTLSASKDSTSDEPTVEIEFPYAAFDLKVSPPYVNSTTRYFPLKRAENSSQILLGRVFLQEAYVVADYDSRQFRVGQALFPNSGTQILKANKRKEDTDDNSGSAISTGAIVGIVVGVVVLLLAAVGGVLWWRRRKSKAAAEDENTKSPAELEEQGSSPGHGDIVYAKVAGDPSPGRVELHDEPTQELDGNGRVVAELHSKSPIQELSSNVVYELEGNYLPSEMPVRQGYEADVAKKGETPRYLAPRSS